MLEGQAFCTEQDSEQLGYTLRRRYRRISSEVLSQERMVENCTGLGPCLGVS